MYEKKCRFVIEIENEGVLIISIYFFLRLKGGVWLENRYHTEYAARYPLG